MPSACVFERELALHWQIEYLHDTTVATANVLSFAGSNVHEIAHPARIVKDSQEYARDIIALLPRAVRNTIGQLSLAV